MFRPALIRLFLILFPLSLLILAFVFSYNNQFSSEDSQLSTRHPIPPLLKSKCPFYLGLSFFPLEKNKSEFQTKKKREPWRTNTLSARYFFQTLQTFKQILKNKRMPLEQVIFTFPLVLTKDKQWMVSSKTFFILSTGERKELSHLTYPEITKLHRSFTGKTDYTPLKLADIFSYLPKQNFLFYLKGFQREEIIKNLDQIMKDKTKGEIYLSSSNEQLLRDILSLTLDVQILYSFKALLKFQIMSWFKLRSFKILPGQGFIIPSGFYPSARSLFALNNQNKLLFFEKDPPYDQDSRKWIQKAHAVISSRPKQVLSMVQNKKPCLIEK